MNVAFGQSRLLKSILYDNYVACITSIIFVLDSLEPQDNVKPPHNGAFNKGASRHLALN